MGTGEVAAEARLGGASLITGDEGSYPAALSHLSQAGTHTQHAALFDTLGLRAPARYAHHLAQREQLAARQAELAGRLARFAGAVAEPQIENEIGLSPDLYQQVLSGFGGPAQDLVQSFRDLSGLEDSAPALPVLAARYPRETGRVVRAYQEDPQHIEAAENPLLEAARQAGARRILRDVFGEGPGDGQGA
jgi:hypothetical protein